ncbi:MAG: oxygenase MpaB family protein [Acidobacteriota bacterium]
MPETNWSNDADLDRLRQQQDPEADATVRALMAEDAIAGANLIFRTMQTSDDALHAADVPAPLRDFVTATQALPPWIDIERVRRGGRAFLCHVTTSALVLLASSLPRGYASPPLCRVLTVSNDLANNPYQRLLGVIQLLVNIAKPGAFEPGGLATVTAQKLRLLHAGVRTVVPKYRPDYRARYGPPVNHEDMLATLMAFSYLVVDGLRRLDMALSPQDEADYYELWRVFAVMMGIHPEGRPHDASLVPATLDDAAIFYASYARRHYTGPDENPEGPILAQHNLEMMQHLVPPPLRAVGFMRAPRIAMTQLQTPEELARIGIEPDNDHRVIERLSSAAVRVIGWGGEIAPPRFAELVSRVVMQGMINVGRDGEVTFIIPDSLAAMRGPGLV